jgi:CheY-like chemotaxis protein
VQVGDQLLTVKPSVGAGALPESEAGGEADTETPSRAADPTKVLLVGTDRRFRSVAAALLERRGCSVLVSERIVGVAELAQREVVDVVVLDAGSLPTAATLAAAELDALDPPVGVVLISEDQKRGTSLTPVLEKWGEFDALFGAITEVCPVDRRAGFSGGTV